MPILEFLDGTDDCRQCAHLYPGFCELHDPNLSERETRVLSAFVARCMDRHARYPNERMGMTLHRMSHKMRVKWGDGGERKVTNDQHNNNNDSHKVGRERLA